MRGVAACLLIPLLLAATPEPGPPSADHAFMLAEKWSCRTMRGTESHKTGTRTGDRIDVSNEADSAGQSPNVLSDRYGFDPATAQWHVVVGTGSPVTIEATAPPWTAATWELTGRQIGGGPARVTYELFSERDMRRKIELLSDGSWSLTSAERCFRGDELPPSDVCIAAGAPARMVSFAPLSPTMIPPQTPDGIVEIVVHLDERSRVRSTTTVRSPSPYLTGPLLQSLRASTFETQVRDCRPIASDYVMKGVFTRGRFGFPN